MTIGQQQLLAGYNSSASRPLSLHNAVYSFTRRIPRITRKSNYCADALSPESQGGITDLDDIENGRSHVGSLPPMRDPPLVADYHRSDEREGGQSGGRVSQWAPRQSKTTDGPPILAPNDPQPFDCSNPQEGQTRNQVYDHAGGAGRSRTESTKDFRGSSACGLTSPLLTPTPQARISTTTWMTMMREMTGLGYHETTEEHLVWSSFRLCPTQHLVGAEVWFCMWVKDPTKVVRILRRIIFSEAHHILNRHTTIKQSTLGSPSTAQPIQ